MVLLQGIPGIPAQLARLPVPPASELLCSRQHYVELLMMGHLFTDMFVFKQLEKLKDQLSNEEGSEVAYALESLSASQPKKRGRFWVKSPAAILSSSHFQGFLLTAKTMTVNFAPDMLKNRLAAFLPILGLSC